MTRDFKVSLKTFRRTKLTYLQHKLRTVMKCYTVNSFILNDVDNTFVFKKTFKKCGIQINDNTLNTGKFEIIEIPDSDDIIVKIYVK